MEEGTEDIEFSLTELQQAGLLDLDLNPSLFQGEISSHPASGAAPAPEDLNLDLPSLSASAGVVARATYERRQALNREHQRRYRVRQKPAEMPCKVLGKVSSKARAQAVEIRLADTTAELENLKAKQHQLEMLLHSAHASKPHSSESGSTSAEEEGTATQAAKGKDVNGLPLLHVNLSSRQAQLTTQQVVAMTVPEFGIFWAEYVKEIGACLIQLFEASDSAVKSRMNRLVFEAIRLAGRRLRFKPAEHRIAATDTNTPCCGPTENRMQIYRDLLATLDLSNDQFNDLMLLRTLFVTRRHQYDQRRAKLIADVQEQVSHPIDNLTRVAELSSSISKLASEDHNLLCLMSRALYCGVLSMQQVAQVFVLSFPQVPMLEDMLNLFAAERGLPTKADLISTDSEDPKEAEWTAFWDYCKGIDPDRTARYNYVPFSQATRQQSPQ